MKFNRSTQIFFYLSTFLLLSDTIFITINGFLSYSAMLKDFDEMGRSARSTYQVVLDEQFQSMLLVAHTFTWRPDLRRDMIEAKKAVDREGQNGMGPDASRIRKRMYGKVGPLWKYLTKNFDVRQLHFHLGPGSLSFLRVHSPGKYGDRMDDIRHIIVDTYNDGKPRTGFETGRVYSGIRGVVPVFDFPPHQDRTVGVLEVGTSYSTLLDILDSKTSLGWSVILNRSHIEGVMWPDFIARRFQIKKRCECVIEASSRSDIDEILDHMESLYRPGTGIVTSILDVHGRKLAISSWPLRDYIGTRDMERPPVGSIVVWKDVTQRFALFYRDQIISVLYGAAAYLMLEIILFFAVRLVTRRLEQEVKERTQEVSQLNERLYHLASTDELTGLHNRRYFLDRLGEEMERATRHNHPLSMILFDIDFFKSINDGFGHNTGDLVLEEIGELLGHAVRSIDISCRYGGEEFCILLPETDQDQALLVAEKLRKEVQSLRIVAESGEQIEFTISLGAGNWHPGESARFFLAAVDEALYRAKREGRNTVRSR